MAEEHDTVKESKQQPRRLARQVVLLRAGIGLIGAALLALAFFRDVPLTLHSKSPDKTSSSPQMAVNETLQGSTYSYLRDADVFNHQFVMLRHNPTGQRLILLISRQREEEFYGSLFEQTLTPMHFSLLMALFKRNSRFEGSNIRVTSVTLDRRGLLAANGYDLAYKYYRISARVDGNPREFEAYVGKILEERRERALLFTFNSRNYASLEPFSDMLKVLRHDPRS